VIRRGHSLVDEREIEEHKMDGREMEDRRMCERKMMEHGPDADDFCAVSIDCRINRLPSFDIVRDSRISLRRSHPRSFEEWSWTEESSLLPVSHFV
jgi:hypothetical protein